MFWGLTLPWFSSNPAFAATATCRGGVVSAYPAEIISASASSPELAAAAGMVPLPCLLTSIVARWEGAGAAGSEVIDGELSGRIGTLKDFVVCVVDV